MAHANAVRHTLEFLWLQGKNEGLDAKSYEAWLKENGFDHPGTPARVSVSGYTQRFTAAVEALKSFYGPRSHCDYVLSLERITPGRYTMCLSVRRKSHTKTEFMDVFGATTTLLCPATIQRSEEWLKKGPELDNAKRETHSPAQADPVTLSTSLMSPSPAREIDSRAKLQVGDVVYHSAHGAGVVEEDGKKSSKQAATARVYYPWSKTRIDESLAVLRKAVQKPPEECQRGDLVYHQAFGMGTVLDANGATPHEPPHIDVFFDETQRQHRLTNGQFLWIGGAGV
ncbi:hypothetical protein ACFL6C_03990 [Myxococcota bacterium]